MRRLTWKKVCARFHHGECRVLNYGADNIIAHVAPIGLVGGHKYYWYGLGRNTAYRPCATIEDCQIECMKYVKTRLDELREKFKETDHAD